MQFISTVCVKKNIVLLVTHPFKVGNHLIQHNFNWYVHCMKLCSVWSQCMQPYRKTWYKRDYLSLVCNGSNYAELLKEPLKIHRKSEFRQAWTECGRSRNRCTALLWAVQQPDQFLQSFRDVNSIKTRSFSSMQKRISGWVRVKPSCSLCAKAKAKLCWAGAGASWRRGTNT